MPRGDASLLAVKAARSTRQQQQLLRTSTPAGRRREEKRKSGRKPSVSVFGGELVPQMVPKKLSDEETRKAERRAEEQRKLVALLEQERKVDKELEAIKRGEKRSEGLSRQTFESLIIDPEVSVLVDEAKEKTKKELREKLMRAVKLTMSANPEHNTPEGKWWDVLKGAQRTI